MTCPDCQHTGTDFAEQRHKQACGLTCTFVELNCPKCHYIVDARVEHVKGCKA